MKVLQFNLYFLMGILLFGTACGGDDNEPEPEPETSELSCKVEGQEWKSDPNFGGATFVTTNDISILTAFSTNFQQISITFTGEPVESKTYTNLDDQFQASFSPGLLSQEFYSSIANVGSAEFTIIEYTETHIKGTFSFTGVYFNDNGDEEEKAITDGEFYILL